MKKKRFLSLMLVMSMLMTMILPTGLPVYAEDVSLWTNEGNYDAVLFNALVADSAGDTINISTPQQLAAVAKVVNDGIETFSGKTIVLEQDIDLTGHNWEPIGVIDQDSNIFDGSEYPFSGNFDGQEHLIKNMFITGEYKYAGLIASVSGSLGDYVVIQNVTVDGTISGDIISAGGIVGIGIHVDFINCNNGVSISTVTTQTGDFGTGAGGILGSGVKVNISNCTNKSNATISLESSLPMVGGIVGFELNTFDLDESEDNFAIISNSVNHGTVIARVTEGENEMLGVGGIGGTLFGTRVINCYNTGDVTAEGETFMGGIAGLFLGIAINCYSTGDLTVDTDSFKGGIVGMALANPNKLFNCSYLESTAEYAYNEKDVDSGDISSVTLDGAAKTSEQMQSATYLGELNAWVRDNRLYNGLYVRSWEQQMDVNGGYPILMSVDDDLSLAKTVAANKQLEDGYEITYC